MSEMEGDGELQLFLTRFALRIPGLGRVWNGNALRPADCAGVVHWRRGVARA